MSSFSERVDALTIDDLVARGSLKWTRYPDALGAWIAEMDFGNAEPIQEALRSMIDAGLYGYATQAMQKGLAEAASGWARDRYGWEFDPGRLVELPDVLHGLGLILDAYLPTEARVVHLTPCYMPFMTIPPAHGRAIVQVPMLPADDTWTIDEDALRAALLPGDLLVLCNPYNPLGKVFTREELVRLSEIVDAAGARVFSDEIHAPLTFPGHAHVPYVTVSEAAAAHTLTAMSASKAWNLAGLKCAQLVFSNDADQTLWRRSVARLAAEAANPGILANIAAYNDSRDWLADTVAYLDVNRRVVVDELATQLPGVRLKPLQGTYLQLIDCRDLDLPGGPQQFFLREAHVALTDGALCGDVGRGHVRMNLATPTPILREIIARMATAVAGR